MLEVYMGLEAKYRLYILTLFDFKVKAGYAMISPILSLLVSCLQRIYCMYINLLNHCLRLWHKSVLFVKILILKTAKYLYCNSIITYLVSFYHSSILSRLMQIHCRIFKAMRFNLQNYHMMKYEGPTIFNIM